MNWSGEQQRLLAALGYTLYQRPAIAAMNALPAAAAPAARVASGVGEYAASEKLLQAVQRAANGGDIAGLVGDIESLRRDPLRKRALWPQLRALRRSH
ncbi:MAG TPA: hypothetical protein VKM35_12305 [Arenimonas sp.]|uniref:hypothetical protein n=1 Tax=Arenimonas sp. TaxID=1872635 RepID=UPI002C13625B|nr:hypothetical protein [Arenimonas sp.]HMB57973.1 hypothetical protein [Arenimonas sp.]